MSMKRTLLSGMLVAPLCLVLPGMAMAAGAPANMNDRIPLTTGWSPGGASSQADSATFAGVGGAGVVHHKSGTDRWGNQWSKDNGSLAGIGGAAVTHSERHTSGDRHRHVWPVSDDQRVPAHTLAPGPGSASEVPAVEAATPVKAAPSLRAKEMTTPVENDYPAAPVDDPEPTDLTGDYGTAEPSHSHAYPGRPVHDDSGSSYHEGATLSGPDGSASWNMANGAHDGNAWYSASAVSAGPEGAGSSGATALAVPGASAYRSWDVGAGPTGAFTHQSHSAADVRDHGFDLD